jgi:hypothetical protein
MISAGSISTVERKGAEVTEVGGMDAAPPASGYRLIWATQLEAAGVHTHIQQREFPVNERVCLKFLYSCFIETAMAALN